MMMENGSPYRPKPSIKLIDRPHFEGLPRDETPKGLCFEVFVEAVEARRKGAAELILREKCFRKAISRSYYSKK